VGETAVTIDVDWAPDVVIDHTARLLLEREVRATWFVTHASPAIDRLRQRPDLFELGIHPNFRAGSTHGADEAGVLEHCLSLVPDAITMRSHSLLCSTPLLALVLETTPIRVDSSLLLMHATGLSPFTFTWNRQTLVRVPLVWEDDLVMEEEPSSWSLDTAWLDEPGLKVFDFHPIHVYLNSSEMGPYRSLRTATPIREADEAALRRHVSPRPGTGTLFVELLDELARGGGGLRIGDLQSWRPPGVVAA
jgi:hypothetical protein